MSKFLVLEFGSKSLKIHRRTSAGQFEKANVPWALGHEVYREGRISAATRQRVTKVLGRLVAMGFRKEGMLAIATGAVRDAPDREDFLGFLNEQLKLRVRILSGREEASLLAQGYLEASGDRPALVIDIGGGSLEMVLLGTDLTALRDSLPLGAIRLHYLGAEGADWNYGLVADYIDSTLREAPTARLPIIHGTGGPVKAISKVLKKRDMSLSDLILLEEITRRDGPPAELTAERRPIFLPGVMVMRRLLESGLSERLNYLTIPIGRIFLQRFLGQTREGLTDSMNARLLRDIRITKLHHGPAGTPESRPAGEGKG